MREVFAVACLSRTKQHPSRQSLRQASVACHAGCFLSRGARSLRSVASAPRVAANPSFRWSAVGRRGSVRGAVARADRPSYKPRGRRFASPAVECRRPPLRPYGKPCHLNRRKTSRRRLRFGHGVGSASRARRCRGRGLRAPRSGGVRMAPRSRVSAGLARKGRPAPQTLQNIGQGGDRRRNGVASASRQGRRRRGGRHCDGVRSSRPTSCPAVQSPSVLTLNLSASAPSILRLMGRRFLCPRLA